MYDLIVKDLCGFDPHLPHHAGAKSALLRLLFCLRRKRSHPPAPLPLFFRKRARSACLLGCKRPRDGTLSPPPFCGCLRSKLPPDIRQGAEAISRSGPFALRGICAHIQSRSKLIILPMRGRPRLCVKQSRGLSLLICAMLIRNGVMAEKFSAHDAALMFSNSFKLLYSRRFPLILTGFPCMLRALALPGSLEKEQAQMFSYD